MPTTDAEAVREQVRARYAEAARSADAGDTEACGCGPSSCCGPDSDGSFGAGLYSELERDELPDAARLASLGCGNPTAVADLRAGEVVLDLGSGGGIDVLLSARRLDIQRTRWFTEGFLQQLTDEPHRRASSPPP
jgi:arsenite methyltransferase